MSLSSAAFFAENLDGTVSVFSGAPGTAKAPLTKTELSAGFGLGACELGSSAPILPDGVCCAFSCCCCCCGSAAGGGCWATARPALKPAPPRSTRTRELVRKSWRRMVASCDPASKTNAVRGWHRSHLDGALKRARDMLVRRLAQRYNRRARCLVSSQRQRRAARGREGGVPRFCDVTWTAQRADFSSPIGADHHFRLCWSRPVRHII